MMIEGLGKRFVTIAEVMPPAGPGTGKILDSLRLCKNLSIDAFTVPTNPVAKPYLDALPLCSIIAGSTGVQTVLHCSTRDHNRLALQSRLWGAKALGIDTVIAVSGDRIGVPLSKEVTPVRDIDVFQLIKMSVHAGLQTGAVFDPWRSTQNTDSGFEKELDRLKRKRDAGARFAVTQPVFSTASLELLADRLRQSNIPVLIGILPLWSPGHADFLHQNVSGITVPDEVRQAMHDSIDPSGKGVEFARIMVQNVKKYGEVFTGICLMPPFGKYGVLKDILTG